MNAPATSPVLQVARHGATAYVRVTGLATFAVAAALKRFGTAALEQGCTRLVLDAGACDNMDSTLMGVLAGLAGRLARLPGGGALMINVPPTLYQALTTLGLDQVLECRRLGAAPEPLVGPAVQPLEAGAPASRDLMIEAHTTLAAMSADNQIRFKDVLAFLKEDMNEPGPGAAAPRGP